MTVHRVALLGFNAGASVALGLMATIAIRGRVHHHRRPPLVPTQETLGAL